MTDVFKEMKRLAEENTPMDSESINSEILGQISIFDIIAKEV